MIRLRWLSKKKKKNQQLVYMFACFFFHITSEHPWNLTQNSTERWQVMHFLFMIFPCWSNFLICFLIYFFFLWLVLQLTRCCGSLPILFPRLLLQGDYPDYLRLCCFQVPRICCTLKVFLFFTYHSDIILHRLPSFSGSNNLAESLQSQYSCSGKAEVTQLHMGQVLHHHSSINYSVRSQNV